MYLFMFTPITGEMIQFDLRIFFNWLVQLAGAWKGAKELGVPKFPF